MMTLKLSPTASARYAKKEFIIRDLEVDYCKRLDIATRAIFTSHAEIANTTALTNAVQRYTGTKLDMTTSPRSEVNACLASIVRDVAADHGWFAAWTCLADVSVNLGLHAPLMEDMTRCYEVYNNVEVQADTRTLIDASITVVSAPEAGSLHQIGHKGLGGRNWTSDKAYAEVKSGWTSPGFSATGVVAHPCTAFAWLAPIQKVFQPEHAEDCKAFHLLGTVDYDADVGAENQAGLKYGFDRAAGVIGAAEAEHELKAAAVVGLLTFDQQQYNRVLQVSWLKDGLGCMAVGPTSTSPQHWVAMMVVDTAGLAPFSYQSALQYPLNRKGMFIAMLVAELHDVIYDMAYSNRVSAIFYTIGAKAWDKDIAQAFTTGTIDALVTRLQDPSVPLLAGDILAQTTFAWSCFNGRYRTWERFVKYTRLLKRSKSFIAKGILYTASHPEVLPVTDVGQETGDAWCDVINPDAASKLRKRVTQAYTPPAVPLDTQMHFPDVCTPTPCTASPDSPEHITKCEAVGLAAAFRRAAVWATSDECCDACAAGIGAWLDADAYMVLVALMRSERCTGAREWGVQCYLVGCVEMAP
ncbi:hypothetical protein LARI1_G007087, partial [Lachnellula arida]